MVVIIFGNYIVNTISGKQTPDSVNTGISKIDNNIPPGVVLHGNLIEEEKLTDLIFDNVKKDERDSVVFAKNTGNNFIAKVIRKDKLITTISPPKMNKQIEENNELPTLFVKNPIATKPAKKDLRFIKHNEQRQHKLIILFYKVSLKNIKIYLKGCRAQW
ncbi:MAG: hypothetical protein Rpha_1246 [Candidatus Ruthia sp. Apha_13_S6]|nr:hypothetical protein [Candidatus Ruthia sp. Apha_13_S6]